MAKSFKIGDVRIGGKAPLALIAGPCVIESEEMALEVARRLKSVCKRLGVPLIYKSSYDKANRSSDKSYRGPGFGKGLGILEKVRKKTGLPVLSDVHCREEVFPAAKCLDALQIPAFLCRQTDILYAAADTGLPVNVKKGQFMSPRQMANVVEKLEMRGNRKIMLTERGATFGYGDLVVDMRSLVIMREYGYPVVFDATHSVQRPGARGDSSGGQSQFIEPLARAAVAVGIDALFIETHPNPEKALSDGPNSVRLDDVAGLLKAVLAVNSARKK